jgi:hypothetical protein
MPGADNHDRAQPRTAEEWKQWEETEAQRAANEKAERLQRILVPGPEVKPADTKLKADFLDRPNLKIKVYRPVSEGGVALPGDPCCWSESWDGPTCGHTADFLIVDPSTGVGKAICQAHALQAAKDRKARAQDIAAKYRAERAQRKLESWNKREGTGT